MLFQHPKSRRQWVLFLIFVACAIFLSISTIVRVAGGQAPQDPLPCSEPDPFTPTFADEQLSPTRRAWAYSNMVVFTDCGLGAENYTLFIPTNQVTSFTWVAAGFIHYETLIWGEFSYDFDTREAVVINHPDHEPTTVHVPRTPDPNETPTATPTDTESGNIGGPGGWEDPTPTPLPPSAYERQSWFWRLTR